MNKHSLISCALLIMLGACAKPIDKEAIKKEVFNVEKDFEKMTSEKSIAEAFAYYADEQAVIKRDGDSLIVGKENIRRYYSEKNLQQAVVTWTPDFIDVAAQGDMAYTYGKYTWQLNDTTRHTGVFHTVWKKQPDGSWRYVWD